MDDSSTEPVGRSVKEWAKQAGIGYSTYFTIPDELKPRRARVGRREIIIESAGDWLERMAARGGVPTRAAA